MSSNPPTSQPINQSPLTGLPQGAMATLLSFVDAKGLATLSSTSKEVKQRVDETGGALKRF